jgi:hypothetical protein
MRSHDVSRLRRSQTLKKIEMQFLFDGVWSQSLRHLSWPLHSTTLRIKSQVPVSFLLFQITARSSPLHFFSSTMRGRSTTHDRTTRGRSTPDRSYWVRSMPLAPFSSPDRAPLMPLMLRTTWVADHTGHRRSMAVITSSAQVTPPSCFPVCVGVCGASIADSKSRKGASGMRTASGRGNMRAAWAGGTRAVDIVRAALVPLRCVRWFFFL